MTPTRIAFERQYCDNSGVEFGVRLDNERGIVEIEHVDTITFNVDDLEWVINTLQSLHNERKGSVEVKTTILTREEKSISSLTIDYNQRVHDWNPIVGSNGVTLIKAYDEPGQAAYVPWFAVYVGEEIIWRINGQYVVEVGYAK